MNMKEWLGIQKPDFWDQITNPRLQHLKISRLCDREDAS